MAEVHTVGGWSALLVPLLLAGFGLATATADGVVGGVLAGRPWRSELATAVREAGRGLATQRRTPLAADTRLWQLGTAGVAVVATVASVVVPLGSWSAADLPIGLVWWSAIIALLWPLLHMVGYSANAAYPMVSSYRFIAQALAYEMPLAISVITTGLAAHSLRVGGVVAAQHGLWFGVWMPVAFAIYLVCGLAASFYGPFATPTGVDLGGGILAELSGVERVLILGGRYLVLVSVAGFGVAIFLGGGAGPWLPSAVWTVLKTAAVLGVLVTARWRWPLVRPERFEELAWVVLLPLSILQALVVSLVVL